MKSKVLLAISFFALFTALVTGIYMYKTVGGSSYMTATVTTIESSAETEGFMVLSESVVEISGSNFRRMYYKDGAKVSKGAKIVSLYNSEADGNKISELDELNEKIANLDNDYVNLTVYDSLKIEGFIDEGMESLGLASYKGRLQDARVASEKLETLFSIKYSKVNEARETEAELLSKKNSLEDSLSSDKNDIYSPIGGIFLSSTDGFEGMIDEERAKALSVGEFEEIMKAEGNASEAFCKIVDNYRWHMACLISADKLLGAEIGDEVTVESEGTRIRAEIAYISEPKESKCVVTLVSSDDFYGLDGERKIKAKVIFNKIKGYVIPSSAFHMYEGKYGVFTEHNGVLSFRKTELIYSSEEYMVVPEKDGGLELYDTVLIDGDLSEFYNE